MIHQLSVRGDADTLCKALPGFTGVDVNSDTDTLTFTSSSEEDMRRFKGRLIPAVTDIITENYERKLLSRIINNNYAGFSYADKKHILNMACNNSPEADRTVTKKLTEYLASADSLIIDGFVKFRLGEYRHELENRVDRAVDNFLVEREYAEFTALLKYFVEIQPPREPHVHIVVGGSGGYTLYNKDKEDITTRCLTEFLAVMSENEMNFDDLLLSTLITLSPAKITLHGTGNIKKAELLSTINEIFDEKVIICDGCELCNIKS